MRTALIALGAALAGVLLLHVPLVFGHHGGTGVCPFGYGTRAAAGPLHHNPQLRGSVAARTRPALGLDLQVATRATVERWAKAGGGTCAERRGQLACSGIRQPDAPDVTSAWFTFDGQGALDTVRTVRRTGDLGAITGEYNRLVAILSQQAGAPYRIDATPADAAALGAGALRQATAEYRFTNYRALLRATNMGNGYVLTEEYANLADRPAS